MRRVPDTNTINNFRGVFIFDDGAAFVREHWVQSEYSDPQRDICKLSHGMGSLELYHANCDFGKNDTFAMSIRDQPGPKNAKHEQATHFR